ncbi:hypothetical protein HS088_TW09G00490 [Tripterygium wilfordii]|uniref:Protein LNK2 n=1 Tax=Tripterygium wilfordii TaxID=458696 RepID=A0A7J7D7Y5_TRIWF|nr:protein LNK2 isoform X2 [Tripterygium wilfordii]KAF5742442.1 hypothetical protein HS088_TW09G00490 [Tripterygium wilfordii]
MFDWNDEEISNIIWGKANESDDHIVPYPEGSDDCHEKKEWNQEASAIKPAEQKTAVPKIDGHGKKLDSSPNLTVNGGISTSGFYLDSWPSLSSSNATKTDLDPLESAQSAKDPENFQSPNEDKEQSDFVDYGWANIGSFDDLDRIFSNDDAILGTVNLGNAVELWSSSKDITSSPLKSFSMSAGSPSSGLGVIKSSPELFETKKEYVEVDDKSCTLGYGKPEIPASHGLQNGQAVMDTGEYAKGKSKTKEKDQKMDLNPRGTVTNPQLGAENVGAPNEFSDQYVQADKQKKLLNPSGQFGNQFLSSTIQSSSPSVLSQQRQIQGSEALQYQRNSSSFVAPSAYGDAASSFSVIPVMSHVQPEELKHNPLLSGYEVSSVTANPVNKSGDAWVKSQTMTPQEKIEKLRRRQQMQALLAIQKQQQRQLGHQASTTDHAITRKCTQENQIQRVDGANLEVEDLSTLSSLDPNSPVEQDDSDIISLAVNDYAVEDTILFRLQDIVAKLDMKMRLCIRDSLFRLAQSSMQRHYTSDTSSSNKKDEQVAANEDINNSNRNANMPDVETETNPIDRTVAHLLFHRPVELSGQHPDTPESPVFTKLPRKLKSIALTNSPMGYLAESLQNKQNFSLQGSKNSSSFSDTYLVGQYRSTPCLDASEDASNSGHGNGTARNIEASRRRDSF